MKTLVSPSPPSHQPTSEQLRTLNTTALSGVSGGEQRHPPRPLGITAVKIPENLFSLQLKINLTISEILWTSLNITQDCRVYIFSSQKFLVFFPSSFLCSFFHPAHQGLVSQVCFQILGLVDAVKKQLSECNKSTITVVGKQAQITKIHPSHTF